MSDSNQDCDRLLASAWDEFCDRLKQAGRIPFRENAPTGAVDRAAGFRMLARNISLGLAFSYENNDPLHPELMHYFDPTRKQGGDNADAIYVGATINGTDTYRISGDRGTALYFAVTVVEKGGTPFGGGVAATAVGDQIQVEADGSFIITISPTPQPGNWLRSTPDTFRVTVRQFFADWQNERPMTARIDRLGPVAVPPPELEPARLAQGLIDAANWVTSSITYWADMLEKWKARPNSFLSYRQLDDRKMDATPGGEPMIAYWQLPRDEVLLIRVRGPNAAYWSVEFGSYWWETMDYRYRLSSTNSHHAVIEEEGELIVVVAHDDPGLPNWLDPSGFSEGYITFRWMQADSCPVPACLQIKRSDLENHLPATVKRISTAARREQLAARRTGIIRRFGV